MKITIYWFRNKTDKMNNGMFNCFKLAEFSYVSFSGYSTFSVVPVSEFLCFWISFVLNFTIVDLYVSIPSANPLFTRATTWKLWKNTIQTCSPQFSLFKTTLNFRMKNRLLKSRPIFQKLARLDISLFSLKNGLRLRVVLKSLNQVWHV